MFGAGLVITGEWTHHTFVCQGVSFHFISFPLSRCWLSSVCSHIAQTQGHIRDKGSNTWAALIRGFASMHTKTATPVISSHAAQPTKNL